MKSKIVVDTNAMETKVALLENNELVELYLERRGHERLVGNIYKGVVQNVLPGMQAAFVDIGLQKNAFLYAKDAISNRKNIDGGGEDEEDVLTNINIKDIIKQGEEIMVQVFKEPGGTKGTRVTTNITLPGRMLVLMPTVDYIGVSRRIEDEEERERLKEVLSTLTEDGMGVIARTAAMGKNREELKHEIDFLKRLWGKLFSKNKVLSAPRLIHNEESLIYRTVRDMLREEIDEIIINDKESFERASIMAEMLAGHLSFKIHHFDEHYFGQSIFDYYNVNPQINKATHRKSWLKSGGYLIIDHTEALTVIDVNTGKFVGNVDFCETALKTNLEAAKEVAKQVRLRNISGIIVVDFIDMLEQEHRDLVLQELEKGLQKDKTKSAVVGMSDLGLVEITRKKERKSISAVLKKDCPYCSGSGRIMNNQTMVLEIYKKIEKIIHANDMAIISVKLHENVAKAFNEYTKELFMDLEGIEKVKIFLSPTNKIHEEKYEIKLVESTKEFDEGKYFSFVG